MKALHYYTQENGQYFLKIQKTAYGVFGVLIILAGIGTAIQMFDKIIEKPIAILAPLLILALGALIFMRTTAIIIIDPKKEYVSWQPFSFKKPKLFYFKDFDGFTILHLTQMGIKGTSTVGMLFLENGKQKTVNLRQTFMTTKPLQRVVEETELIMNLAQDIDTKSNTVG